MKKIAKMLCWGFLSIFPLYVVCLVVFTQFSPSDLFSERISLLKDRPANLEKDVVIDLTKIGDLGGIAAYSEVVVKYMINSRPNYRWIILHDGPAYANGGLKQFLSEHQASHNNVILVDTKSKACVLFKWMYYIAKSAVFRKIDERFSRWLASQSPKFNDTFYRFKQMFLHGKVFVDRHCDLMFSLTPPFYYFSYGIPQVSVIHDVIYLDAPGVLSTSAAATHIRCFVNNFNSSKKLISISYFTKDCVLKYFENMYIDKITVIRTQMADRLPNVSEEDALNVLAKFHLEDGNYFVFPSRFWKHKNHTGLVRAFYQMLQEHKDVSPTLKLVLMGGCKDKNGAYMMPAQDVLTIVENCGIKDRVVLTDYTSDVEFNAIMSKSLAVVNPTFYEGFGMPVAEAMLLQKPVVCSNVASLPEVGGDAALYFNPYAVDDIANKLYQTYIDADLRRSMIEKGNKQVQKFTNREQMLKDMLKLLEGEMASSTVDNRYKIDWSFCWVRKW